MVRVLITGATGSLARGIIPALQARGHSPFGLVRPHSPDAVRDALACPTRSACLSSGEGLAGALEGMDAVIHCAGGGRLIREQNLRDNNTETTRVLVEELRRDRQEVRRVVLTSSYAAMGSAGTGENPCLQDEATPWSVYGRAKLAAETLVLSPENPFAAIVIRPPAIHGPDDLRLLPLFRAAQRGWAPLPHAGRTFSWIHSSDVHSAHVLALKNGAPGRAVYAIDDGAPRSIQEILDALGKVFGRTVRRVPLPMALAWPVAWANEQRARWTQKPTLFTRDKLRDLRVPHWAADTSAIRRDLGWTPRHDLCSGFKATVHSHEKEGRL